VAEKLAIQIRLPRVLKRKSLRGCLWA